MVTSPLNPLQNSVQHLLLSVACVLDMHAAQQTENSLALCMTGGRLKYSWQDHSASLICQSMECKVRMRQKEEIACLKQQDCVSILEAQANGVKVWSETRPSAETISRLMNMSFCCPRLGSRSDRERSKSFSDAFGAPVSSSLQSALQYPFNIHVGYLQIIEKP